MTRKKPDRADIGAWYLATLLRDESLEEYKFWGGTDASYAKGREILGLTND